jgi:putative spermidine/putrescine transport system ATP-binding protein
LNGTVDIDTAYGMVKAKSNFRPDAKVLIGIRPERIQVKATSVYLLPEEGLNTFSATLKDIVPLGARTHLYGNSNQGDRILCERPGSEDMSAFKEGMPTIWQWPISDTLIYPDS